MKFGTDATDNSLGIPYDWPGYPSVTNQAILCQVPNNDQYPHSNRTLGIKSRLGTNVWNNVRIARNTEFAAQRLGSSSEISLLGCIQRCLFVPHCYAFELEPVGGGGFLCHHILPAHVSSLRDGHESAAGWAVGVVEA